MYSCSVSTRPEYECRLKLYVQRQTDVLYFALWEPLPKLRRLRQSEEEPAAYDLSVESPRCPASPDHGRKTLSCPSCYSLPWEPILVTGKGGCRWVNPPRRYRHHMARACTTGKYPSAPQPTHDFSAERASAKPISNGRLSSTKERSSKNPRASQGCCPYRKNVCQCPGKGRAWQRNARRWMA